MRAQPAQRNQELQAEADNSFPGLHLLQKLRDVNCSPEHPGHHNTFCECVKLTGYMNDCGPRLHTLVLLGDPCRALARYSLLAPPAGLWDVTHSWLRRTCAPLGTSRSGAVSPRCATPSTPPCLCAGWNKGAYQRHSHIHEQTGFSSNCHHVGSYMGQPHCPIAWQRMCELNLGFLKGGVPLPLHLWQLLLLSAP